MQTSKSPRKVLLCAHAAGVVAFPAYAHRFSPKKFTLPQLFACLVLKESMRLDYRGVCALLADASDLRAAIGLGPVPHFTTLQKAAARLLAEAPARRALDATLRLCRRCRRPGTRRRVLRGRVALAAADGTGLESRHVSAYFLKRSGIHRGETGRAFRPFRRHPKLAACCDTRTHLILACRVGRGPGPDHAHLAPLLRGAGRRVRVERVAADAGFDSEANHVECRRGRPGVRTLIPALTGRPTDRPPSTRWRRRMARALGTRSRRRRAGYTQRWQIETVFSMIKRRQGPSLSARSYHAQNRQMRLRVLTHNLMILLPEVFYRAGRS